MIYILNEYICEDCGFVFYVARYEEDKEQVDEELHCPECGELAEYTENCKVTDEIEEDEE